MYSAVKERIDSLNFDSISKSRASVLDPLVDYIQANIDQGKVSALNFICTHNSRRSQFSQLWAQVAAEVYQVPCSTYSGGVEVTACNSRTIDSLVRFGFLSEASGLSSNPTYRIRWSDHGPGIELYSKLYDDPQNPRSNFAAIMTCSHADENCPFVMGCDVRLPIRYEDPKAFDDTPKEAEAYDRRSFEIATEMFYVFSRLIPPRIG